jgi:uncharacterized protein (DUF58 family)
MGIHWFIIITVIVLLLQSLLYKQRGLKHLTYQRYFNVENAFAGDEVEMVEEISNRKLLPLPWLRLEARIQTGLRFQTQSDLEISAGDYSQNHRSIFSLPPYTEIVRRHKVLCVNRGLYRLNSATLTCGDIFGFRAQAMSLQLDAMLAVYPHIMDMEDIPLPAHSWLGDHVVRRWIVSDPFMISGVREYRSGDALNHINWKATARSGSLQVHHHDYTANHRLMILLNYDVTEEMWDAVTDPELIEQGISYAASIAQYTSFKGLETGFGCNGYSIDAPKESMVLSPRLGREYLTYIYEQMARLLIKRSCDFHTFLERLRNSHVSVPTDFLMITSSVSEKVQQHINELRQQGHAVEILILNKAKEEADHDRKNPSHSEQMA